MAANKKAVSLQTAGEKRRLHELSVLNVLFTLMVVTIHLLSEPIISLPKDSGTYMSIYGVWKLFQFVSQGFLFISGIKLFLKKDAPPAGKFYLGRLRRVYLPYVAWIICYYQYFISLGWVKDPFSLRSIYDNLALGHISSHFYFVVVIMQFYLLTPLIRRLFDKCNAILLVGYSLLATLIFGQYLPQMISTLSPDTAFANNDRIFTSYLIYFMAGCAVGRYYDLVKEVILKNRAIITLAFLSLGVADFYFTYLSHSGKVYLYWCDILHFSYVLSAIAFSFMAACCVSEKIKALPKFMKTFDKSAFTVYLSHSLVIRVILNKLSERGVTDIGTRFVITVVGVAIYIFLAVYVWSFVKSGAKRIIVKRRKT